MPTAATLASAAPADRLRRHPTQLDVSPYLTSASVGSDGQLAAPLSARPPLQTGVRPSVRTRPLPLLFIVTWLFPVLHSLR